MQIINQNKICYVLLLFVSACSNPNNKVEAKKNSLLKNIGDKFVLEGVIDSNQNEISIDFSKNKITIIDFWFTECKECKEEMQVLPTSLTKTTKDVQVISVSINNFDIWKQSFKERSSWSFLSSPNKKWIHYVLKSRLNQKSQISIDRERELSSKYNITFYPSYFVIDNNGVIIDRPKSINEYLNNSD